MLVSDSATKVIERYKRVKKDTAHYYIDWLAMDQLGNQLFKNMMTQGSYLKIMQQNFQTGRVMVSLANIYEIPGMKKDATRFLKKAVAINERNEKAKNRLKALGIY